VLEIDLLDYKRKSILFVTEFSGHQTNIW